LGTVTIPEMELTPRGGIKKKHSEHKQARVFTKGRRRVAPKNVPTAEPGDKKHLRGEKTAAQALTRPVKGISKRNGCEKDVQERRQKSPADRKNREVFW